MTDPNLAILEKMLPLIRQKEALLLELAQITRRLEEFETGLSVAKEMHPTTRTARKGRRKGKTEELVLGALNAAGDHGLSVKEIAEKTRIHTPTLRVWIYTAGKKLGLRKIAPGRFAFKS